MGDGKELRIRLFGTVEATTHQGAVAFPSRKAAWLLSILALRQGVPIPRQALAVALWPDSTDAGALHNLRQALVGLRRALGAGNWIETVSPWSILLRPGPHLWVDAIEFDEAVREGTVEVLERAAEMYRGPLLTDCDEPFALMEREPRERAFLDLADRLGHHYASGLDPVRAISIYRRALAVDPYRESSVRGLMTCFAASGEAAAALELCRGLARRLRRELNADVDPETKALFRSIRSGTGAPKKARSSSLVDSRPMPRPLTSLVGRESEVEEVATLLDRCRLVTLVGVGGVGKTRLALAVAEEFAERSLEGAAFVDLASLGDPEAIALLIAGALGIPEPAEASAIGLIAQRLDAEPCLVVLDNCEHLADGVARILQALFSHTASARVLATSRQPVCLAGEVVWPVSPLTTPVPCASPEESRRSPAVRLFLERSPSAGKARSWTDDEIRDVASVCRRLDGIPLAIELAAARTSLLSIREVETRLDDRFAILGGGSRATPRHQTLRAAIEWSWDLLQEPERDLFERLSVFHGGATLEAVEAVSNGPALDLLSNLVERSLVVVRQEPKGSRFAMLETIREFAAERFSEGQEQVDVRVRHADFFSRWAQEAAENFYKSDEALWFERLERDHDNLRTALEWYHSEERFEDELRMAVSLSRFWDTHGRLSEGRGLLERALRAPVSGLPPDLVAEGHEHAGWMAGLQRDCEAARAHYEKALGYFRHTGNDLKTARNLNCLAGTSRQAGDTIAAQVQYQEALALFRKLDFKQGAAMVLVNLGLVALRMDDPAKARAYFEESIAEASGIETGGMERHALTLSGLSLTDFRQGCYKGARDHAILSLRLIVEAQALVSMPDSLGVLGVAEAALGAWDRAARLLGAEQGLASSLGVPLEEMLDSHREQVRAGARRALGTDGFHGATEAGWRLSLGDAIAFALEG